MGGRGRVAGYQPMSTAVHRSPNKLRRSNSIFNLCLYRGVIFICFYKCRLLFQSHYGGHGDCAAHSGEPVEQAGGRLAQPSPPVRDAAAPAP